MGVKLTVNDSRASASSDIAITATGVCGYELMDGTYVAPI